jgi:two-component system, chemotaxis family, response regulator Rcp1
MTISPVAPLTLLLVEDNPADVFLVKEAMREEGLDCEFHVVEDGEKAIAFIDRMDAGADAPPDLLLLDLNVPRRTGDEVLGRIRKSEKCANVAIVVITSSDSPHDRQRAKDLGADEYFRKPANLEQFMELGKMARRLTEKSGRAVV